MITNSSPTIATTNKGNEAATFLNLQKQIANTAGVAAGALSLVSAGVALAQSFKTAGGISNISMGLGTPVSLLFQPWQLAAKALAGGAVYGTNPLPDVITSDKIALKAQITDHYIEDNTAMQDHIAIEPAKYTLTGVVCELVFQQTPQEQLIRSFITRLASLGILTPAQDATALEYLAAYDILQSAIYSAAKSAESIAPLLGVNTFGQGSKQKTAFAFLERLFNGRATMTVSTPWNIYKSMAIESIDVTQDDTSRHQTVFDITFKEIRVTSTPSTSTYMAPKYAAVSEQTQNAGKAAGKDVGSPASNNSTARNFLDQGVNLVKGFGFGG
jgi:hypothetical protein